MRRTIASWFGSGLVLRQFRARDIGSGTVGALLAFLISMVIGDRLGTGAQLITLGLVTLGGLWAIEPFVADEGDAGWIVADEAAGVLVATVGLTLSPAAIVAFVVFRAADIFKTIFPGVAAADRMGGRWGVMADDLVAGLYGLMAGQAVRILL